MRKRVPILAACLGVLFLAATASAQVVDAPPAPADYGYKPPLFYVHAAVGIGFDWMSSGEMNDLMTPYKLGGFGFNYFAGFRVGIMNIFQYERRADGDLLHDFFWSEDNSRIDMTHAVPRIDLFKINPLFWTNLSREEELSIFLVYGKGKNARFLDEEDSGWTRGDVAIYGVELSMLKRFTEVAISLEYRTCQYYGFDLSGYGSIDTPFKSSFFVLALHYGIGLGI